MIEELSNEQRETYDAVFQHPISGNVERRSVRSMFEALGEVTQEHNGNLKIDLNGHTLVLHPADSRHTAGFDEVMQIRHFLKAAGGAEEKIGGDRLHLLVIIESRQALIYRSEFNGWTPEQVVPYDPQGSGHHVHNVHDHGGSPNRPVGASFYKAIAKSLKGADEILMFGASVAGRNAMDALLAELELNHHDVFAKVASALVVDEKHISEELLLERARAFYHVAEAPKESGVA
jgi:hypothetical protein